MSVATSPFQALRSEIARIEAGRRTPGGLALGALHEVAGGGYGAVDGATGRSPPSSPWSSLRAHKV